MAVYRAKIQELLRLIPDLQCHKCKDVPGTVFILYTVKSRVVSEKNGQPVRVSFGKKFLLTELVLSGPNIFPKF